MNAQINLELSSGCAYLGMAAHFEHSGYPGFAAWMSLPGEEERAHAQNFFDYVLDRGGRIELQQIQAAPVAEPRRSDS